MEIQILFEENSPVAQIVLRQSEAVNAINNSLVGFSEGVQMSTKMLGGQLTSFAGIETDRETLFSQSYRAIKEGEVVFLAPDFSGELRHVILEQNEVVYIMPHAFLAASDTVQVNFVNRGVQTFDIEGSLRMLQIDGPGHLLFAGHGSILPINLSGDSKFSVARGHLVGMGETVRVNFQQIGGIGPTILSTGAQVLDFGGTGRIYLQSRTKEI